MNINGTTMSKNYNMDLLNTCEYAYLQYMKSAASIDTEVFLIKNVQVAIEKFDIYYLQSNLDRSQIDMLNTIGKTKYAFESIYRDMYFMANVFHSQLEQRYLFMREFSTFNIEKVTVYLDDDKKDYAFTLYCKIKDHTSNSTMGFKQDGNLIMSSLDENASIIFVLNEHINKNSDTATFQKHLDISTGPIIASDICKNSTFVKFFDYKYRGLKINNPFARDSEGNLHLNNIIKSLKSDVLDEWQAIVFNVMRKHQDDADVLRLAGNDVMEIVCELSASSKLNINPSPLGFDLVRALICHQVFNFVNSPDFFNITNTSDTSINDTTTNIDKIHRDSLDNGIETVSTQTNFIIKEDL